MNRGRKVEWPVASKSWRVRLSPLRFGRSLRPERADDRAGLPHLAVGDRLQFLLQLFPVILTAVRVKDAPGLLAGRHFLVQLLEHRPGDIAEALEPVEGTALGRRRAV